MNKPIIANRYLRLAGEEVKRRSRLYETLAWGAAGDAETLDFLAALPRDKQQPNLLFVCAANAATLLPSALPTVVWRAGLDLNPLDAADPVQAAWLETLVWPEQTERLARLRAALRIAATVRPRVIKGSLLGDKLAQLCAQVPRDATVVVFHTAVLAYVAGQYDRDALADRVTTLCRYWISNESPRVFPSRQALSPDAS